jgi:hypothetical protein
VIARSALNLMDRVSFAHRQYPVLKTHFVNTLLTFTTAFITTFIFVGWIGIQKSVLNYENFVMAVLLHTISMSISFAFRKIKVSHVSIISKSADIFIPLLLFLISIQKVDPSHLFQFITGLIVLPLLLRKETLNGFLSRPGFFLTFFLVLQSVVLEFAHFQKATTLNSFFIQVTGILFWRSLFGFAVLIYSQKSQPSATASMGFPALLKDPFLLSRSILMLINYATFVLALSGDYKGIVWAMLNSTGLISIFFANHFLKEKMAKSEVYAFSMIVLASIGFYVLGGHFGK